MSDPKKIDEEQKSRSVLFLLSAIALVVTGLWAVWNDNISRRPWKHYQHEFRQVEYERADQAFQNEQARLAEDPEYLKAVETATASRKSFDEGEGARSLSARQTELDELNDELATVDLDVRFVKSELEEAWYEYEHAKEIGGATEEKRARVDSLEEYRVKAQAELDRVQGEVTAVEEAMATLRASVTEADSAVTKLVAEAVSLEQQRDGLLVHVGGPLRVFKVPKIEQTILEEFDRNAYNQPVARVDRCMSCHIAINRKGFEDLPQPLTTHPDRELLLAKHPPEQVGCTPCHDGQGAAPNSTEQAHGHVIHWEHPLLHGDELQARCDGCHQNVENLPHAERLADGRRLFEELGCHGCHLVTDYGELTKVGPYLRRVAAKVDPSWLTRWVTNPHDYRPHTRMPNFMFDDDDGTAVAAYLLSVSAEESSAWLEEHPAPSGIDPANAALVAEGEALTQSVGCKGCHAFVAGERGPMLGASKDIAPNLSNIAEKTDARWIFHWLKNPRHYSPASKMPSLRLSDGEASAVASYLLTLGTKKAEPAARLAALDADATVAHGETLVRKFGCAGCHDIPGMESESRIGVELSTFENKTLDQLFFGERGDIPHTWYDWTYNKIKTPRTYETERIEQLMPNFDLPKEDIEALIIFLAGRNEEYVPKKYRYAADDSRQAQIVEGQRLVARYNCTGCHVVDEQGGFIRALYEETPSFAPPILNGEGSKVQPDWLFGFLQDPIPIRPWLQVRMPTFNLSNEETNTLVNYFTALAELDVPFVHVAADAIPEDHITAGKLLLSKDYFDCFSCHVQGANKPEGPPEGWAPDFAMAKDRLNPDWIVEWLHDPQQVQPGTKMPSFYPGGPDDLLGGSDDRQIDAIRDYLMILGTPRAQAATVLAEPPPDPNS